MSWKKTHCSFCGDELLIKKEGTAFRYYCNSCDKYYHDNPLPVVSIILIKERKILLVKRKQEPHRGKWGLPMGFAAAGESIENAAKRELNEKTGINAQIAGLIDVDSGFSETYGDLLFLTFEAGLPEGEIDAGSDTENVMFFPLDDMPVLSFPSNVKAFDKFLRSKLEYWAIVDSFQLSLNGSQEHARIGKFMSDRLIKLIEENAEYIGKQWLEDVRTNNSTPTYWNFDPQKSKQRNKKVISQFSKWLGGFYCDHDIRRLYSDLGEERKKEGYRLSEIISALSLTRKHIWDFALSHGMWNKTEDIYAVLELDRRMMMFFDKASFYVAKGYEINY